MTPEYGAGVAPRGQGAPWDPNAAPADRRYHPGGAPGHRPPPPGYGRPPRPAGVYGSPPQRPAAGQPGRGRAEPPAPPRRAAAPPPTKRRSRKPLVSAVVLVLAIGAGAGWWLTRDRSPEAPTAQQLEIADRQADPKPLTVAEVFPAAAIPGGAGRYSVLKTQLSADCGTAAAGTVVQHLASAGCNQVVRATVKSPDGVVVVTLGIFNLESLTKNQTAAAAIKTAVDEGAGRFGGLVAGNGSDIIGRAAANLAWDVRGHFLIYSVTAKPDGSAIPTEDTHTGTVRRELVQAYLGDTVIAKREAG